MNPNEYQTQAARTLIDAPPLPLTAQEHMIVWNAIGLAGEAGEVLGLDLYDNRFAVYLARAACGVAELVKKGIFHERGLDQAAVRTLLDEVVQYAAALWATRGQIRTAPIAYDTTPLRKELGDVCWYTAALCSKLHIPLGDILRGESATVLAPVLAANITKLQARFPGGWSTADAAARADEVPA